jgi:hypothetical protein
MLNAGTRACVTLLVAGLTSCATSGATSGVRNVGRARGYSIQYVDITPTPGTVLARGQSVALALTVRYTLEVAEKGRILMVLQKNDNSPLIPGRKQASVEVVKGTGETTLSDTFEVPTGVRVVRLFVPLRPEGVDPTSGELLIEYPVR